MHVIMRPADKGDFVYAPYFRPNGEAFCSLACIVKHNERLFALHEAVPPAVESRPKPGITCDDGELDDEV